MNKRNLLAVGLLAASNLSMAQSACDWTPIWQDDFNNGLNTSVWSREVNGDGGGNNELQYYTDRPENLWVENGILNIKAIREDYLGHTWTSARLRSKEAHEWTYGKVEARIKLPNGSGTWPAFWMMPTEWQRDSHGWPNIGEIDIMEAGGTTEDIHGTLHYGAYWPYNGNTGWPDPEKNHIPPEDGRTKTEFQTYAVEWYEDEVVWLVNDVPRLSMTRAELDGVDPVRSNWDSFHNRPFHIILNLAIGGWFSGNPDGSEAPEQLMQVDHVTVYKNPETWSVEGDTYVYRGETHKTYHIDGPQSATYQWNLPEGATIQSGQGSNEIRVAFGNAAQNGDISVSFDTGCAGTQSYAKPVTVEQGETQMLADYEAGLGVTHRQNGVALDGASVVANPAPSAENNSASVLHYVRNGAEQWDNLKITDFGGINAGELRSGRAKLFVDVFIPTSENLLGKPLNGGLENAAAVSEAPNWDGNTGRLASFGDTLGQSGQWQTLQLNYKGTPDTNLPASSGDTFALMVEPGFNKAAELYFDNLRVVWPDNGYHLDQMVADFDGTSNANLKASPATSGAHSVVANPAPDAVNGSANVLRYERDSGADYDTLAFNSVTAIPDALDAQHGMVRVAVDVYTDQPAGTLFNLNLENELQAASVGPEQWQVGRHSFYQAETSTSGQWETLEFNYNFPAQLGDFENDLASAPFTAVDQLIFLAAPGEPSGGTYYFDNFRVMGYNQDAPPCTGSDCDTGSSSSSSSVSSSSSSSVVSSSSSSSSSSDSSSSQSGNCDSGCLSQLNSTTVRASVTRGDSVDIHYTVNSGAQQNLRMTSSGSGWQYDIAGLSAGDEVSVSFTVITNGAGESLPWRSVTVDGSSSSSSSSSSSVVSSSSSSVSSSSSSVSGDPTLVSANAVATASTEFQSAGLAVDGDGATRWESAHGVDPSWITLDLLSTQPLSQVVIDWEAANAADYVVQGSNDNSEWTDLNSVTGGAFGDRTDTLDVSGSYRYLRIYATARSTANNWGYSIYNIDVYAQSEPQALAVAGASASTTLQGAGLAIDGDASTRWESAHGVDPSSLTLDLGESHQLAEMAIDWEAANASDYIVQGSSDTNSWTDLASFNGGEFGARTDTLALSGNYRYVRLVGTARSDGNNWGYSIFEVRLKGY